MSYIIFNDYKSQIQVLNLNQVIGNDLSIIATWQDRAEETCKSKLRQKFDVDSEFTDTNSWSPVKAYNAKDRVYLDATLYNSAATYAVGALSLQAGNVYQCTTVISSPEAFNPAHWALLGLQFTMYFVAMPKPEFVLTQYYNLGDQVYWKNKTYTAKSNSATYDKIQYPTLASVPPINYFPDQQVNGQPNSQWGNGTPYSIPAGTPLTDPSWTQGDNRSPEMVEKCIDIILYRAHGRISPNNVPEFRHNNYLMAMQWLKDCANGDITPTLAVLQPRQGSRLRLGGEPKQQNTY